MTDVKSELDQFLETSEESTTSETAEATATDAKAEASQEEAKAEDKGEKNAETPSAEKDESSAKAKDSDEETWTKAAYLDEKRKRQELEKRLQELEAPKQEKAKEEEVDIFADPDKFKASVKQEIQQANFRTRLELSQDFMKDLKPDYAEKEGKFLEMMKADDGLRVKLLSSVNPAKFAYETATKQIALDAIGDPVAYREKLRQELLAELKKGEAPNQEEKQDAKAEVDDTPSLATASASKSNTAEVTPSLEELFSR